MMMDIFSSFDPRDFPSIFSFSLPNILPWVISLLITPMIFHHLWTTPSRLNVTLFSPLTFMMSQVTKLTGIHLAGFASTVAALFIFLMLINLLGLAPYIFGLTGHIVVSLALSLPIWLSLIMSAIMFSPSSWAASFLPTGTPPALSSFLILIEAVSISVRPITLAVRLTANITAGHTILGMVGIYASSALLTLSASSFLVLFTFHFGYMIFEFGVAMVQGYIFCLLVSLYSNEHPSI
uniref:ATP synthase subunit a n=1 Tax=Chaetopterus variopedatus TaxID=34590 RepID=A0A0S2N0C3_CHAVR|nr:ATP synthase F0 subunit 6 [Chaetopterus variopedatus]ALO81670.1 ATP synthase F0 subunit 6 [Chaetopterus variopedatus]